VILTAVISSPTATARNTTAAATVAQYSSGLLTPLGITQHQHTVLSEFTGPSRSQRDTPWVGLGRRARATPVEDALYAAGERNSLVTDDGERRTWATIRSGLAAGLRETPA